MNINIPLTNITVTTEPYLLNIGQDYTVNLTAVNSTSDNLLITTVNAQGQKSEFVVYAGNNTILKKISAYQITFAAAATSTIFTAVISWPGEVDPASLQVTGTIKTDIGQRTDTLQGTNPVVPPSPLPTDIGQLGSYAKDATLTTINTTLGTPLQNGKIPIPFNFDTNGNIGIGLPTGAINPTLIRSLVSTDNPDTSVNQANNYKTDIGAAGTYAKDATLTTINTSLTPSSGFVTDIGHTSSYAKDTTVASVNTTLGSPAQDASVKAINTTLGSPFQVNGSVGLIKAANTNDGFTGTIATTGTAQQFTATSTVVQHFQIRNTSTTGNVQYVGSSGAQSLLLYPNGMFLWDANPNEKTDISTWYVSGTAADTYAVNYQV